MSKSIVFSDSARKGILNGMSAAAKVIGATMGPRGLNAVLSKSYGTPEIVNDGITILKEIELDDKLENAGIELLKEAANKTNDFAGDGTSGTTILTEAILKEGIKNIASGANGVYVKKGIDKATKQVIEHLKEVSLSVDDNSKIKDIASISANNEEVGNYIADAMEKVGKEGVVTLEDSKTNETYVDVIEGIQFDKGMVSPYFAENPMKVETTLEEPTIIAVNENIKVVQDILPMLEKAMTKGKPILMIVDDMSPEIVNTLVINKLRGILDIVVVKAPGYGDNKKEQLLDLSVFTGCKMITTESGMKLKDVTADMFGTAKKVIITKDKTTIMKGAGTKESIEERYNYLKEQYDNSTSDYDKGKLKERMGKLKGAVAVLYVGGNTETEQKELKLRVEDALNSTRSAIDEGIVSGGGIALAKCVKVLNDTDFENDDVKVGYNIIKNVLTKPLKQIVANSGFNAEVIETKVLEDADNNMGIDASTGDYVNMIEKGIIDPLKVVRSELQNSASVAGMILTTNSAVVDKPSVSNEEEHKGCSYNDMCSGCM